MEIANIDGESLLNDLRNFNEIFKQHGTYNNITVTGNHGYCCLKG